MNVCRCVSTYVSSVGVNVNCGNQRMNVPSEENSALVTGIAHLWLHDLYGIIFHVELNNKLTRFIRFL